MISSNIKKLILQLENDYPKVYQDGISVRWIRQDHINKIIDNLGDEFAIEEVGSSIEGRVIRKLTWGSGPISVALWSQMHGDESTATRALFDLFNYLQSGDEEVEVLRKSLTLHIIPMLNPDGAEVYQRRNAAGIDINRDALKLVSPESRILKALIDSSQAEYGFNLHDQSRYYRIGETEKPATFTFLTPAFDIPKTVNDNRKKMMNLILDLKDTLETYVPGQVGRYDDTFNYRAFGDNIQSWGTATILFEAGELPGDPERETVRKLFYLALVQSLYQIAEGLSLDDPAEYFAIPENNDMMADHLILNVLVNGIEVDLALNEEEGKFIIMDIGDLSNYRAYNEVRGRDIIYSGVMSDLKLEAELDTSLLKSAIGTPVI